MTFRMNFLKLLPQFRHRREIGSLRTIMMSSSPVKRAERGEPGSSSFNPLSRPIRRSATAFPVLRLHLRTPISGIPSLSILPRTSSQLLCLVLPKVSLSWALTPFILLWAITTPSLGPRGTGPIIRVSSNKPLRKIGPNVKFTRNWAISLTFSILGISRKQILLSLAPQATLMMGILWTLVQ